MNNSSSSRNLAVVSLLYSLTYTHSQQATEYLDLLRSCLLMNAFRTKSMSVGRATVAATLAKFAAAIARV